MENNAIIFDQIVNQRRSIRLFDTEHPYDKSIVQRSLERAILSPNSSNMQLWEFYRIISPQGPKLLWQIYVWDNALLLQRKSWWCL